MALEVDDYEEPRIQQKMNAGDGAAWDDDWAKTMWTDEQRRGAGPNGQ
jgi:hypothetical protein